VEVIGHEQGVDGIAVAEVVAATQSLTLETESLIEPDGRLVPDEDVKLELADVHTTGPIDGCLEQSRADPSPPVARCDHEAEIGDVGARRVRVAGKGETSDDQVVVGSDEDRCVRMASNCLEVATLVEHRSPRLGGQKPATALSTDLQREEDEGCCVGWVGGTDCDHETTRP